MATPPPRSGLNHFLASVYRRAKDISAPATRFHDSYNAPVFTAEAFDALRENMLVTAQYQAALHRGLISLPSNEPRLLSYAASELAVKKSALGNLDVSAFIVDFRVTPGYNEADQAWTLNVSYVVLDVAKQ
jgi:hypothetical protein